MIEEELQIKEVKIRDLMERKHFAGIILSTQTNFLWFTGGRRNQIIKNADTSLVHLLITKNKKYLLSTRSDADRIMDEELAELGFEPVLYDWYRHSYLDALDKIGLKGVIGCDFYHTNFPNIEEDLKQMRISLSDFEVGRVKELCKEYTRLLTDFCLNLKPGVAENDLAADLQYACVKSNIDPFVLMVGSDERINKYRHPVATDKKVQKYVLIATCVERDGINVTLSRSVYFGKIPDELEKKQNAVNVIEATYFAHALPETPLRDLFAIGKAAYSKLGYPKEWKNHTQGGIVGYTPREYPVTQDSEIKVGINNLFGWNPTIRGVKAEDFIVVQKDGIEQLTIDPRWPFEEIQIDGKVFRKPKILEIDS
jgi:Xaa-Pro aminopeptidase